MGADDAVCVASWLSLKDNAEFQHMTGICLLMAIHVSVAALSDHPEYFAKTTGSSESRKQ